MFLCDTLGPMLNIGHYDQSITGTVIFLLRDDRYFNLIVKIPKEHLFSNEKLFDLFKFF